MDKEIKNLRCLHRCTHKVAYYETDAMRIVHHSNYLRWMEIARCDFLEAIALPFSSLEANGISSPVLHAELDYKRPARFEDEVEIALYGLQYDGLRYAFYYEISRDGDILVEAKTRHCFVDLDRGRPMSLKRSAEDMHEKLQIAFGGDRYDSR